MSEPPTTDGELPTTDERDLPSRAAALVGAKKTEVRKRQEAADKAKTAALGVRIFHISKVCPHARYRTPPFAPPPRPSPSPLTLGLGGGSRLTGVLGLGRAEVRDLVCTVCTTHSRSRELILDSLFWSKLST